MRTSKVVHIVSCHAEGGVAPPPGTTVRDRSRRIAGEETPRQGHGLPWAEIRDVFLGPPAPAR